MIRSAGGVGVFVAAFVVFAAFAFEGDSVADEPVKSMSSERKKDDTTLDRHRTPVEVLTEKMIGTASRAVRFDWRRKSVGVGLLGSQLLELNNFKSARLGAMLRVPLGSFMTEFAATRVLTWGSESTEKLALTPYRQLGRPNRFELDFNLAYPIAEGVATARPGFVPATQLVFSAVAGFRYLIYPSSFSNATFGEAASAIVSPQLSTREIENLEGARLAGMQIDKGRFNLLAGLSLDVYFGSGGFVSSRALIAGPITGSDLGWWWELTAGAGWMF